MYTSPAPTAASRVCWLSLHPGYLSPRKVGADREEVMADDEMVAEETDNAEEEAELEEPDCV